MNNGADKTFDPATLAYDLCEVERIYGDFFAGLSDDDWERPVKDSPEEWNLRETIAHLCALNGAGLESINSTLKGEPYVFEGLTDRYAFKAYNLKGIDEHKSLFTKELSGELLQILAETAHLARNLRPGDAEITSEMPIYNRPVRVIEAMSIIMFHTGLHHSAQVAEPAGVPPLWTQLPPEIRHRTIGRVMRATSLLYRHDLGGDLEGAIVFDVEGPGGGKWHVRVSPKSASSGNGSVAHPKLTIRMRETDVFCQMMTRRLNLPVALLTGRMKLRGDLRIFLRMGSLFSVDARK